MDKLRKFLKGKKTYLVAAVGVLGAVITWADGSIDMMGLLGAVWAAVMGCFIRAGVGKAEPPK